MYYFFFSSRRRHTRYWRDWSSDVCSSDLLAADRGAEEEVVHEREVVRRQDDRAGAGDLLRGDPAGAEEGQRVERGEHAHRLVDPVGPARARALVEAVEVLDRKSVV